MIYSMTGYGKAENQVANNKKIVVEDFRKHDILETRAAERLFTQDTNISMSEINRIEKVNNCILICTKSTVFKVLQTFIFSFKL